jgi:deoxyadenosine/deoxycytidine kinase
MERSSLPVPTVPYMSETTRDKLKLGIVGPCACGKTTLIQGLAEHGYQAKHIVQEHSYVPGMWQIISKPDLLIFLDVSFDESMRRRAMNWNSSEYAVEQKRLEHARENADFYLHTDGLSPVEVLNQVLSFLNKAR